MIKHAVFIAINERIINTDQDNVVIIHVDHIKKLKIKF